MTQARGYLGNRADRGTSHLSLLAVVALIALFASRQILAQQPSAPAWKRTRDLRVGPIQETPGAVAFRTTSSNLLPTSHSSGPR